MPSQEELQRAMRDRTDEELYCLLYRDAHNCTPDAIDAAREEFSRRQLNEQTMRSLVEAERTSSAERNGQHGLPAGRASSAAPKETFWGALWATTETYKTSAGWGCIILVCQMLGVLILVWLLAHAAYTWLDSIGWVTHDHDTPVWIHGDWVVGEYRDCDMLTARVGLKPEVRAELPRLFCGDHGSGRSEPEFLQEFPYDNPNPLAAMDAVLYGGDWRELDNMFHVLPVSYHGRIDRLTVPGDLPPIEWRCQRLSASLECKAVN